MSENEVLRFLLPDLLGRPSAMTDMKGDYVYPIGFEPPPDSYVFFISVSEWLELKKKS